MFAASFAFLGEKYSATAAETRCFAFFFFFFLPSRLGGRWTEAKKRERAREQTEAPV